MDGKGVVVYGENRDQIMGGILEGEGGTLTRLGAVLVDEGPLPNSAANLLHLGVDKRAYQQHDTDQRVS